MSNPLQPINYMQQRDLTPSEWWEFYQQKKIEMEASVRECELEIKDLTIRAQRAENERDWALKILAEMQDAVKWAAEMRNILGNAK